MNANGTEQMNITHSSTSSDGRPAWSHTQNKITFMSTRNGNMEIYLMNADGSNQIRLTNNTIPDDFPNIK
jgi:Tol biopolymer transport system component